MASMKKILKKTFGIILRIFLVIIAAIIIALTASFINNRIARKKDLELLKSKGLCNLVSAGSFNINTAEYGDKNAEHTFVAIPGMDENTYSIDIKYIADKLSDDCRVIALDTPGYGISDNCDQEMTVSNIVESYRTALKNMGENGPYILLPHSIGGVYTTYWLNTYPDEIEGAVFLDGTFIGVESTVADQLPGKTTLDIEGAIFTLGLHRFCYKQLGLISSAASPEDMRDAAKAIDLYHGMSKSELNEMLNAYDNLTTTWSMMKPNDIPKMYICAEVDDINDFRDYQNFMDTLLNFGDPDPHTYTDDELKTLFEEYKAQYTDEMHNGRTEYIEKLGNCEVVSIPGSHAIYLHKPDEVAAAINKWISDTYE